MKILIAADLHIGANKFGTTNEKWCEPLEELVKYAIDNRVDVVAFAGDLFHHRRPTTWASEFVHRHLETLEAFDIQVVGADGNHDDGVAADTVSATWHLNGRWASKKIVQWRSLKKNVDLNIVLVPWVTPAAYDAPTNASLNEQLEWAQTAALDTIKGMLAPESGGMVNILIGHAMVAYGPGQDDLAPSPGLQWAGKDVVFDYTTLTKMFNGGVYLGHVHDPRMEGYVGSSQPTDWGDAGQTKSFTELEIIPGETSTLFLAHDVPYKTSLRLLDATDADPLDEATGHYDVGRWKCHVEAEECEPTVEAMADVRKRMNELCDRVESIEVTKERVVVQRVATDTPLAAMRPEEAADAWIRNASLDGKTATDVKAKFQTLVVQSEK